MSAASATGRAATCTSGGLFTCDVVGDGAVDLVHEYVDLSLCLVELCKHRVRHDRLITQAMRLIKGAKPTYNKANNPTLKYKDGGCIESAN